MNPRVEDGLLARGGARTGSGVGLDEVFIVFASVCVTGGELGEATHDRATDLFEPFRGTEMRVKGLGCFKEATRFLEWMSVYVILPSLKCVCLEIGECC